eukprot:scaffold10523_cov25-Tisochrysis_lutea.AAC.1
MAKCVEDLDLQGGAQEGNRRGKTQQILRSWWSPAPYRDLDFSVLEMRQRLISQITVRVPHHPDLLLKPKVGCSKTRLIQTASPTAQPLRMTSITERRAAIRPCFPYMHLSHSHTSHRRVFFPANIITSCTPFVHSCFPANIHSISTPCG